MISSDRRHDRRSHSTSRPTCFSHTHSVMRRCVESGELRVAVFVTVIALCLPTVGISSESRKATLTTDEVRQRLLDAHRRVRAWYIEYESPRELMKSGQEESYLRRVVAAKVPDLYFHWNAHGTLGLEWEDDPLQQRFIMGSSFVVADRPPQRSYIYMTWAPEDPLPGTAPNEFLFVALGWWPFPKRPPPTLFDGAAAVLPAIASSADYRVRPDQELVGERWCHILEYPGRDKLWLDCDRGCAILVREMYGPNPGQLFQRIEASGHREVQPGIWVPATFRNMVPGVRDPKDNQAVDSIINVLNVRLNEDVKDDLFEFEPLPGSIELTVDGVVNQEAAGSEDYLNEVVDWIQRNDLISIAPAGNSIVGAVVEYSLLGVGTAALALIFSRRWLGRRRPAK